MTDSKSFNKNHLIKGSALDFPNGSWGFTIFRSLVNEYGGGLFPQELIDRIQRLKEDENLPVCISVCGHEIDMESFFETWNRIFEAMLEQEKNKSVLNFEDRLKELTKIVENNILGAVKTNINKLDPDYEWVEEEY